MGVWAYRRAGYTWPNACHAVRAKIGRDSVEPTMFAAGEFSSTPSGERLRREHDLASSLKTILASPRPLPDRSTLLPVRPRSFSHPKRQHCSHNPERTENNKRNRMRSGSILEISD